MYSAKSQTAIYARKSSESEDRQVLSIESQVEELRAFAAREGLDSLLVFNESMSAKAPGRPVFNELMESVRTGKVNQIICWKLDRLARNPVDGGVVIWAMEERKLSFIHTPQRTFQNTGNDKFWMQLEFGMAKKYVDDLSDNVKRGLRAKIAQGWMPGLPPLGYLNEKKNKKIIRDPQRFPLIRKMWDLMLTGNYTPSRVLDIATSEWGLTTRKMKRTGGGPAAYSVIYKILSNPFYYGAICYNGEIFQGSHEPLISKDEFDRVQEILTQSGRPRPKTLTFAYTGLITCGECGAAVTAERKLKPSGKGYIYYHCTKRKRSVKCSQKVIEEKALEDQIMEFLKSIEISVAVRDWCVKWLRKISDADAQKELAISRSLRERLAACQKESAELVNIRLRGLISDEEFKLKKSEIENEKIRITELLNKGRSVDLDIEEKCRQVFNLAATAKMRFRNGTIEEKRAILKCTGSNLRLIDRKLQITPQIPFAAISKVTFPSSLKIERFEPAGFGSDKRKIATSKGSVFPWLGTIQDVRTFYRDHPSFPTLKDILLEVRTFFERRRQGNRNLVNSQDLGSW